MGEYYRFIVGKKGIYEKVELDCLKTDLRKKTKPDGSWLTKIGKDYPGAISFWTKEGMMKYVKSGLSNWHASVVEGEVEVIIIKEPNNILYRDKYQIIILPTEVNIKEKLKLNEFLKKV